ncbi:hypothetical protein EN866_33575 [Mesorhizobium sp. M2D.F.Ca.ET.223.01.1.1]|uniref:hypothetical protein n=1 Tax=Mesorhizobium sp. M2D.F.Ca.ET.223.01.1.1 TaxID=2563940 RepID=UPI0010932EF0|nr:hypothetical protein [Mesorhizobium sp. M2D.F.Ca.ET.223.01.1.1]TGR84230.1 hypothetical protein EN866_33575 [Mesorhizobium sp. M2D.F.Ca.ET.223.01.1.1]TGT64430.1 hypothetical protein EN802_32650 [bacterium M00.F.Ca.ET.159.01.1.1]TGT79264.1 hypothetical protein EN800_31995 [bacterium M00.F.Ca.ET.157.01.1.1]
MHSFDEQNKLKRYLEDLLKEIDGRQEIFSKFIYTGLQDIFHEPAMRGIGLNRLQIESAFMARRLQQAMPLSAQMSPIEVNSLNAVVRDVGLWKEQTGYAYHRSEIFFESALPDNTDVKVIDSTVKKYFTLMNLKDVSSAKGSGYLTWRGNEFLENISLRLTFDIRRKYNWKMRFNIGIFRKDGTLLCNISDWEVFGKVIYATLELNFNAEFEHCDKKSLRLNNYLSIIRAILNRIKSWQF